MKTKINTQNEKEIRMESTMKQLVALAEEVISLRTEAIAACTNPRQIQTEIRELISLQLDMERLKQALSERVR